MERLLSDEAMVEVIRVDLRYSNAGRAGQTIERIKSHASTYWILLRDSLVTDGQVPVANGVYSKISYTSTNVASPVSIAGSDMILFGSLSSLLDQVYDCRVPSKVSSRPSLTGQSREQSTTATRA